MVAPLIPVPPNRSLFLHVLIPKLVRQKLNIFKVFFLGDQRLTQHGAILDMVDSICCCVAESKLTIGIATEEVHCSTSVALDPQSILLIVAGSNFLAARILLPRDTLVRMLWCSAALDG